MVFNATFNNISVIVVASFNDDGNRSKQIYIVCLTINNLILLEFYMYVL